MVLRPRLLPSRAMLGMAVLALAAVGCHTEVGSSNGPPPIGACGHTLGHSLWGVKDLSHGWPHATPMVISPLGAFVRVASGCELGGTISWSPADAFELGDVAKAADGKVAAVNLKVKRAEPAVLVIHNRQGTFRVPTTVREGQPPYDPASAAASP